MILNFMTKFPAKVPGIGGQDTDFLFKIDFALLAMKGNLVAEALRPKRHTIREDAKGRWKAGNTIHFAQGAYKQGRVFAEGVCTYIQFIRIEFTHGESVWIMGEESGPRQLSHETIDQLAVNDGFRNSEEFYAYFRHACQGTAFTGKIIHWTNTRY